MMYTDAGESRGYCFVTFQSLEDAQKVYDNYDSNEIDGKWVDCKPSQVSSTSAKPGDWYCPMCGDLVFAWRESCNMCGFSGGMGMLANSPSAPAPSAGKPGDWVCESCGDLVFSYRDMCNKCGKERGTGGSRMLVKPGDWTCPNCS